MTRLMTPQGVGAYGEKLVEAALLRRGWIPSDVNATVKNAARFDIITQGPNGQLVPIRVKTCGPGQDAFQYGFKPGAVPTHDIAEPYWLSGFVAPITPMQLAPPGPGGAR